MKAPQYRPATKFYPPVAAPYVLDVEAASLAELMTFPPAWEIVLKHAPIFKALVKSPQAKPYLTNMTVDSYVTYGIVKQEVVDKIDAEFKQFSNVQWGAP